MGFTGFAGYPRESSPFIEVLRLREKKGQARLSLRRNMGISAVDPSTF
jgi:hypothetical protein